MKIDKDIFVLIIINNSVAGLLIVDEGEGRRLLEPIQTNRRLRIGSMLLGLRMICQERQAAMSNNVVSYYYVYENVATSDNIAASDNVVKSCNVATSDNVVTSDNVITSDNVAASDNVVTYFMETLSYIR